MMLALVRQFKMCHEKTKETQNKLEHFPQVWLFSAPLQGSLYLHALRNPVLPDDAGEMYNFCVYCAGGKLTLC